MATVIVLCQAGLLALMAAWLTVALRDNLRHPEINEQFAHEVLSLSRIERDFPVLFDILARRRITSPRKQKATFGLIVVVEGIVALLLWAGAAALVLAATGLIASEPARALGLVGAFGFVSLWAGFVIAGNHFCYWLCHEGAQNTHFQLLIWGLGSMILLALA